MDPSNGVALCRDCHVEFHRRYGKGGHGPEHLVAFMEGGRDLEYLLSLIVGWRDKGGIADLKKAIHYIQFLIESEESRMCSTPLALRILAREIDACGRGIKAQERCTTMVYSSRAAIPEKGEA